MNSASHPLSACSRERVFLRPVRILLLHGAPGLWSATPAGGLPGRHAARPQPGSAQVLEVAMETLLQPNQAGSVGTPTVFSVLFKGANTGTEIRVSDYVIVQSVFTMNS